jgi:hypothetical protein
MKHSRPGNAMLAGGRLRGLFPAFMIIIGTALIVQLLGSYHARSFIIGDYFFLGWVVLRIAVPLAVIFALGVPLSRIGLGMPRFDRTTARIMVLAAVVLCAAFTGIYFFRGYFNFYSNAFGGVDAGGLTRFANFMIFTGSTLTGWEFLHRGFLLMGLTYVLAEREKISSVTAVRIAVMVVWVFEVVFHFIKPELEALGLLAGSPFLSWLALRTKSIWPSFLIHFIVELLFIATLIMQ